VVALSHQAVVGFSGYHALVGVGPLTPQEQAVNVSSAASMLRMLPGLSTADLPQPPGRKLLGRTVAVVAAAVDETRGAGCPHTISWGIIIGASGAVLATPDDVGSGGGVGLLIPTLPSLSDDDDVDIISTSDSISTSPSLSGNNNGGDDEEWTIDTALVVVLGAVSVDVSDPLASIGQTENTPNYYFFTLGRYIPEGV